MSQQKTVAGVSHHTYARPGPKTTCSKKKENSTQNKSQHPRVRAYEVRSFLSTDSELSTDTCSKNVYSRVCLSSAVVERAVFVLRYIPELAPIRQVLLLGTRIDTATSS